MVRGYSAVGVEESGPVTRLSELADVDAVLFEGRWCIRLQTAEVKLIPVEGEWSVFYMLRNLAAICSRENSSRFQKNNSGLTNSKAAT